DDLRPQGPDQLDDAGRDQVEDRDLIAGRDLHRDAPSGAEDLAQRLLQLPPPHVATLPPGPIRPWRLLDPVHDRDRLAGRGKKDEIAARQPPAPGQPAGDRVPGHQVVEEPAVQSQLAERVLDLDEPRAKLFERDRSAAVHPFVHPFDLSIRATPSTRDTAATPP